MSLQHRYRSNHDSVSCSKYSKQSREVVTLGEHLVKQVLVRKQTGLCCSNLTSE